MPEREENSPVIGDEITKPILDLTPSVIAAVALLGAEVADDNLETPVSSKKDIWLEAAW